MVLFLTRILKIYYISNADIVFVFTDKNNPKNILKCVVSCRNGKDMDKKNIKVLKGNKNNQEKNSRFRLETTNFKVISGKWPGKDVKLKDFTCKIGLIPKSDIN